MGLSPDGRGVLEAIVTIPNQYLAQVPACAVCQFCSCSNLPCTLACSSNAEALEHNSCPAAQCSAALKPRGQHCMDRCRRRWRRTYARWSSCQPRAAMCQRSAHLPSIAKQFVHAHAPHSSCMMQKLTETGGELWRTLLMRPLVCVPLLQRATGVKDHPDHRAE